MSKIITDGNQICAEIAFKLSQVIPVYPITPSTSMAEFSSLQSSQNKKNIWGESVTVVELQSEQGVAGTMHGALLGGALSSTFTCSQGLLLMMPNMFKIAGENLPAVIHCSARAISSHALSIFCDHSDVMNTRGTGFCIINSSSVQECQDMALISHLVAMKSSLPILHFFDGFRTSHEIQKIEKITDEQIKTLLPNIQELKVKKDALCPKNPQVFGTAQNPDVFFLNKQKNIAQYENFDNILQNEFLAFEKLTGRKYENFEFVGNKNAENIIISMGSSTQTLEETIITQKIQNTSIIKVRVFRPFNIEKLLALLPSSVKKICVLDRTKEVGANPLFLDVSNAVLQSKRQIEVISGVYGLGGGEFSPSHVLAVVKNLEDENSKQSFTVGIEDDVTLTSLPIIPFKNNIDRFQLKIFGLGSDGSVSASKNIVKILGEKSKDFIQGFFEYDSKKAGSVTTSHIRKSKNPIQSAYLIDDADIISINNFSFLHKFECLKGLKKGGKVILNTCFSQEEIEKNLPNDFIKSLVEKEGELFTVDANSIARKYELKEKISVIMQGAILKISNLLTDDEIEKETLCQIEKSLSAKGNIIIQKNFEAMQEGLKSIKFVQSKKFKLKTQKSLQKAEGFERILNVLQEKKAETLCVSMFASDGKMPTGTSSFEKRNIALFLPKWNKENCIKCGQCTIACPHGALKSILIDENHELCDDNFANAFGKKGKKHRIQIAPENCTGCGICASFCPAIKKALTMQIKEKIFEQEQKNFEKYSKIESIQEFSTDFAKGVQYLPSYFSSPGACGGCGQTPYIRLATSLFGEKMTIANATGCSSIYCGSFPSCPFLKNSKGEGAAWASSLFEDNAEFGLGISLASSYSKSPEKSVWIIGGDGWACDIGFGGIDHILQSKQNVNILVLDNENYANTGGQMSKSTQTGTVAKFCENGKKSKKKNLGLLALSYQNCFVAQVSMGANIAQTIKAFKEAEAFDGPSLIIAYSPCIEHGIDMSQTMQRMKDAVTSGYFNLFRYNPFTTGLVLDFENITNSKDFTANEGRFSKNKNQKDKEILLDENAKQSIDRLALLQYLSKFKKQ